MKKILLITGILSISSLYAETNTTNHQDKNITKKDINESALTQKQIEEQIKLEEKYAKEQKFYQGDAYDLKSKEINEKSLDTIPAIEPDYDFDITDVYRDDQ